MKAKIWLILQSSSKVAISTPMAWQESSDHAASSQLKRATL